jgi:hypothetical protein
MVGFYLANPTNVAAAVLFETQMQIVKTLYGMRGGCDQTILNHVIESLGGYISPIIKNHNSTRTFLYGEDTSYVPQYAGTPFTISRTVDSFLIIEKELHQKSVTYTLATMTIMRLSAFKAYIDRSASIGLLPYKLFPRGKIRINFNSSSSSSRKRLHRMHEDEKLVFLKYNRTERQRIWRGIASSSFYSAVLHCFKWCNSDSMLWMHVNSTE